MCVFCLSYSCSAFGTLFSKLDSYRAHTSETFRLRRALKTSDSYPPRARTPTPSAPRGVAQATASRDSPAGRGTPCTAGDRRLARRVRGPAARRHASCGRAPEERPAGRPAILYISYALRAPRVALCASRFALCASRACASRCALRAARFALLRFRRS